MNKLAFVFPGQGAQTVGMGKDFCEKYDVAKRLFREADEALGYSIQKMCFEGPAEDLKLTANTQPAILTMSVIAYEILKEHGIEPDITGGHSLGEYSALVAAGVMDFQNAVLLVHKRGTYMQEAVPVGKGGMAAIIGLGDDVIEDACMKAAGAKKAVILPVSAPFHSTLMQPAAVKLAAELDKVEIRDAKIPVVSNYTGELETKAEEIKANLVAQADHPVKWIACVKAMQAFGADTFVEAGPGKTLCGFNKRIDRSLKSMNVENIETLEKTLDYLREVR